MGVQKNKDLKKQFEQESPIFQRRVGKMLAKMKEKDPSKLNEEVQDSLKEAGGAVRWKELCAACAVDIDSKRFPIFRITTVAKTFKPLRDLLLRKSTELHIP